MWLAATGVTKGNHRFGLQKNKKCLVNKGPLLDVTHLHEDVVGVVTVRSYSSMHAY